MVGKRSLSDGARSKKMSKAGNPSAQKRRRGDEEEEDDVVFLGTSRLESEGGKRIVKNKAKNGAQDSDEEEIRLLFEGMVASRNAEKESRKIGKSGGAGSSRTGKQVEKKKNEGKKKAVAEEEEREQVRKGKKVIKNLKKKNNVVVEDEDDVSGRESGSRCKFPMNRIQKIMKDHDASAKLSQEAIFLANKASEKFLELYCREAYACAFLDHKKQVSYDHLASVVSKRKRFDFLSDIIPQRVKAEDALAEVSDK